MILLPLNCKLMRDWRFTLINTMTDVSSLGKPSLTEWTAGWTLRHAWDTTLTKNKKRRKRYLLEFTKIDSDEEKTLTPQMFCTTAQIILLEKYFSNWIRSDFIHFDLLPFIPWVTFPELLVIYISLKQYFQSLYYWYNYNNNYYYNYYNYYYM